MYIENDHLIMAYKKLKRLVYYDNIDLHLRKRLAEFESNQSFKNKLSKIKRVLNSDDPLQNPFFEQWLKQINFRIVPKKIDNDYYNNCTSSETEGTFISNVTSAHKYNVTKVNYFFDGPIELHLIAVLWIMNEGYILDSLLGDECYGNRIHSNVGQTADGSPNLYIKYHELYTKWRDEGIKKAQQLLVDEKKNVCILGLDLQEFYYRIIVNYRAIARTVANAQNQLNKNRTQTESPSKLLSCLKAICFRYREAINPLLKITHNVNSPEAGIPIGLCSSQLIANWHLKRLDEKINSFIDPSYYGRYVDDILLVFPVEDDPSTQGDPVGFILDRVFVKSGILEPSENNTYKIASYNELFLQQSKCILQYFDAKHSIAGLIKFKKKLAENVSDFRLLPVDESESFLEDVAYDLLYEGSINKFRSVKGLVENRYELAKHLARQIIIYLHTNERHNPKTDVGIRKFFKGQRAIEFYDLWERVLTFFLIANDEPAANKFKRYLYSVIKRIYFKEQLNSVSNLLVKNLTEYLNLCIEMTHALSDDYGGLTDHIEILPRYAFRKSNLIRHHFVRLPLINYTKYTGPLIAHTTETRVEVDHGKMKLSPRFVNFDECMMLTNGENIQLKGRKKYVFASQIYETINGNSVQDIDWEFAELSEES